jgi:predicted amidohydrolase
MKPPAETLSLALRTFDPGLDVADIREYTLAVIRMIEAAWDEGAELVLLPEFTWMGLEPHVQRQVGSSTLAEVAEAFESQCLPLLKERLQHPGRAAVLGTVPSLTPEGGVRNRAWIVRDGGWLFQDKLHLTPWESGFEAGDVLRLWSFGGFRMAVIICLDIEVPELSVRLRDSSVDLILCPSATETLRGVERVNRCASARSVELGCHVAVSHLTGRAESGLIDVNIGRAAFYRPSQSAFKTLPFAEETETVSAGVTRLEVRVEKRPLDLMRRMTAETNPALLGKELAGIQRCIPVECA